MIAQPPFIPCHPRTMSLSSIFFSLLRDEFKKIIHLPGGFWEGVLESNNNW
jgi:hypothetical protein